MSDAPDPRAVLAALAETAACLRALAERLSAQVIALSHATTHPEGRRFEWVYPTPDGAMGRATDGSLWRLIPREYGDPEWQRLPDLPQEAGR